jgi:hypothetical protein
MKAYGDLPGVETDADPVTAWHPHDPAREAILGRGGKNAGAQEQYEQCLDKSLIPARHGAFLS